MPTRGHENLTPPTPIFKTECVNCSICKLCREFYFTYFFWEVFYLKIAKIKNELLVMAIHKNFTI